MIWQALIALVTLAAGLLAAVVVSQRRRIRALERQRDAAAVDLERLQDTCARLAPATVIDRLITDGHPRDAQRAEATVLFADLVGYTAMSEHLEAPVLATVLNGYFQHMSDAISARRGHISTFIGDGILAYFGAFEPNPWQCDDAAHAALAMRTALLNYNRELSAKGLPQLAVGIGLHRGHGIAGWVGSRERMEYAFVGRTVNLAARVQGATRLHGTDILVTQSVRERLDPQFVVTPMPPIQVKGIRDPVATFALREFAEERHAPQTPPG